MESQSANKFDRIVAQLPSYIILLTANTRKRRLSLDSKPALTTTLPNHLILTNTARVKVGIRIELQLNGPSVAQTGAGVVKKSVAY
jgi:hypothetical protein